jgi:hypothetical protein
MAGDDDWDVDAEMARELAAFDLHKEDNSSAQSPRAPDHHGDAGDNEDDGGTEASSSLLDSLVSYMQRCNDKYSQMEQAMQEDLASVQQLASQVPASVATDADADADADVTPPLPVGSGEQAVAGEQDSSPSSTAGAAFSGPEPEPEPEPAQGRGGSQLAAAQGPEIWSCVPAPSEGAGSAGQRAAATVTSAASEKKQQIARLCHAFGTAEGKLLDFAQDKLAVGAELAPLLASSDDGAKVGAALSLADMVDASTREAELWADEEAAKVDREVRVEVAAAVQLREDATADIAESGDGEPGAAEVSLCAPTAGCKEEAEQRMREAAESREHEKAVRHELEEREKQAREATLQAQAARVRQLQQAHDEEVARLDQRAERAAAREREREDRNSELQQLLTEQLRQMEARTQARADAEAAAASRREDTERARLKTSTATQVMHAKAEQRAREAMDHLSREHRERAEAIERSVQARMDELDAANSQAALLKSRLEEQKVASQLAAQQREERSEQRAAEQLQRKAVREQLRREQQEEWEVCQGLLQQYEQAVGAKSSEQLKKVVDQSKNISRLRHEYSRGVELLQVWRSEHVDRLREDLIRARSCHDVEALHAAIQSSTEYQELDDDLQKSTLSLRAWELMDGKHLDDLRAFVAEIQSQPALRQLTAECVGFLDGLGAEKQLDEAMAAARATWDLASLLTIQAKIEAHGIALHDLAKRCGLAVAHLQLDKRLCDELTLVSASPAENIQAREDALQVVATQQLAQQSPLLHSLQTKTQEHVEYMHSEARLREKLSAARGSRDTALLEGLLVQAGDFVAVATGVSGTLVSRVGGLTSFVHELELDLQTWKQQSSLLDRIELAKTTHNQAELQDALSAAAGVHELAEDVKSGHSFLEAWREQGALCERLQRARKAEEQQAVEQGVAESHTLVHPLTPALCIEIENCQAALRCWEARKLLSLQLEQAMQAQCYDSICASIEAARVDDSLAGSVTKAESLLKSLEWQQLIRQWLPEAIEQNSTLELSILVEEAKAGGLQDVLDQAAPHLQQLQHVNSLRQQLLEAAAVCDSARMLSLAQTIKADKLLSKSLMCVLQMVAPSEDLLFAYAAGRSGGKDESLANTTPEITAQILYGHAAQHVCQQLQAWNTSAPPLPAVPEAWLPCASSIEDLGAQDDGDVQQRLDMGLEDLRAIPELNDATELLTINLKVNKIRDTTGLAKYRELRELFLNDNQIESLGDITKLDKLRHLSIEINRLACLDGIESCSRLRSLCASSNRIEDITPLARCTELERLELYRNHISDLHPLEELCWLQHLDLRRNRLTGIEGLGACPVLQCLQLQSNQIEYLKASNFHAPLLRELWLSGNPLKSLDFLAWMPSLEQLHAADAEIKEGSPLHACCLLRTLDLSFNQLSRLTDLAALSSCSLLEVVRLNDNPVAHLPDYRDILISALPSLRDLDNEPADRPLARIESMQATLGSLDWCIGSNMFDCKSCPAWCVNDTTGCVDWSQLLRSQLRHQRGLPLPGARGKHGTDEQIWYHRSFQQTCVEQRGLRASLIREHKRKARVQISQSLSTARHSSTIAIEEEDAAALRQQFATHYANQKDFDPNSCRHQLVRNQAYTARILSWRQTSACTVIQSMWRGLQLRRRLFARRHAAAKRIQSVWQRYWVRKMSAIGGDEAIRIQASFRGHYVRRRLRSALDSAKYLDTDENEFSAVDEDFALPGDIDDEWAPDLAKSLVESELPIAPSNGAKVPGAPSDRRETQSEPAAEEASGRRGSVLSVDDESNEIARGEQSQPSPGQQRHQDRVASMFQRMQTEDARTVEEWGLTNPETIAAMKKKARKYRRHESKAKQKKLSAAQRYQQWMSSGGSSFSSSPSPTPPSSARSDRVPRSAGSGGALVRRIGSGQPPPSSPSLSTTSDLAAGGLQHFSSGAPNLRVTRDLASRESSSEAPAALQNNWAGPTSGASAAAPAAPWGMAAGSGSLVVGRGANKRRAKVRAQVPRVAALGGGRTR